MDEPVMYRRAAVRRSRWIVAWGLLALVALLPAALDGVHEGPQRFALDVVAYSLTWGIPLWVGLLTLWSLNRYGRITLTRTTLRVGRESLRLTQFDVGGVRRMPLRRPSVAARMLGSAGPANLSPSPTQVRQFGGAFGPALGADSVVLPLRDGTGIRFGVLDRAGFLSALCDALE